MHLQCSPQVCEKVIYVFYISGRYRVAAWIRDGENEKECKGETKVRVTLLVRQQWRAE